MKQKKKIKKKEKEETQEQRQDSRKCCWKKVIKRWLPWLAIVFGIACVCFFLYVAGFRIIYAPELENSWDAMSAYAAWASVIASFIAILVAIWIPKRIADRQDKIALFEKRYDCYTVIQNLLVCAKQMEDAHTNKGIQTAFRVHLGQPEKICENESATVFALQLKQKQVIIVSGEFLFPHYNTKLLQEIIDVGVDLIFKTAVSTLECGGEPLSTQAAQVKQKYCQLCKEYENTYIEQMKKELQLS